MTRTGTVRRGRSYGYYSCAGCKYRGETVCKGRHVPQGRLDTLIVENLKERLLNPARMQEIISALIERQSEHDESLQRRKSSLLIDLKEKEDRLKRLYRAIEDGVVDHDDDIGGRIKTLKTERDIITTSIDRLSDHSGASDKLTPERVDAFVKLVHEKLEHGDIHARKAYIRAVVTAIEIDDDQIRVIGDKTMLAAAISGKNTNHANVRGFVRKWCGQEDSNLHPCYRTSTSS